MAVTTRLGLWGHGTRRTGSFAGKASAAGQHPVGRITRYNGGLGHGSRRGGSFAGKAASTPATSTPEGWTVDRLLMRRRIEQDDEEIFTAVAALLAQLIAQG